MLLCPDTGPLLVLARLERLDLLGSDVALVDAVVQECLQKDDEAASAIASLANQIGVITVLRPENFPARLGPGESAVLSWAVSRRDEVTCVLDDRAARVNARALGLSSTGTLGLLLRAKADGRIRSLRPWVEKAVLVGLYLDDETITKALQAVGE